MPEEYIVKKFDRIRGGMEGVALFTKPSTIKNVQNITGESETFVIETCRHAEMGDFIFVEMVDRDGVTRLALPPKAADAIAAQRDSLTTRRRMYPNAAVEKTQDIESEPEYRERRMRKAQVGIAGAACNQRPMNEREILSELFSYHPPTDATIPRFAAINQAAKNFAEVILQNCPGGADRLAAINKIREARMVANAAIALDGLSLYY